MTRSKALGLLALAACMPLAACGGDDENDGGGGEAAKPAVVTFVTTETPTGVELKLRGSASVKPGVTRVEYRNDGKGEHEAQLIRVEGDHSQEEVLKVLEGAGEGGRIPEWFRAAGGSGPTAPGASTAVTLELEPGTYYAIDVGEPEGDNPKPYFRQGGTRKFEVAGDRATATFPAAPAKVTAKDYSFTATGLQAGQNRIEFDNAGKEPHHLIAAPIAPGSTIADVRKFLRTEKGRPPVAFNQIVGTSVIDGGTKENVQLDLKKGKYALLCFITDRGGGPPHVAKGMVSEATVQ